MRALRTREKKLGCFVLLVLFLICFLEVRKRAKRTLSTLGEEHQRLTLEIQEKQALSVRKPLEVKSRSPVKLLEELLLAPENDLRVMALDRTSESTFKVVVEGRFLSVMRLLGSMERDEGWAILNAVELMRVPTKDALAREEIRATLTIAGEGT